MTMKITEVIAVCTFGKFQRENVYLDKEKIIGHKCLHHLKMITAKSAYHLQLCVSGLLSVILSDVFIKSRH
jgi:hypothetical protein